jgi:hypothetical protein
MPDLHVVPHQSTPITAMPRLIDPLGPLNSFVQGVRSKIRIAVSKNGRGVSIRTVTDHGLDRPINYLKLGELSGVYFTLTEDRDVGFLYYHKALRVSSKLRFVPAEALAYRFVSGLGHHGVLAPVFWDSMLPRFKLVLTDSQYTEEGKRWWYSQYSLAARNPARYGILVADPKMGLWGTMNPRTFDENAEAYWGTEEFFERFRFAIYLKSYEEDILRTLVSKSDFRLKNAPVRVIRDVS